MQSTNVHYIVTTIIVIIIIYAIVLFYSCCCVSRIHINTWMNYTSNIVFISATIHTASVSFDV